MNKLNLYKTATTAQDGTPVRLVYDEEADILEIFFGDNESATGVELTDYIILRLNKQTKRAISLMFLHISILTERTQYGPRSYPLNKLQELPEDLCELVLQLINSMPVSQFLKLSHFQASPTKQVPLTYVETQPMSNRSLPCFSFQVSDSTFSLKQLLFAPLAVITKLSANLEGVFFTGD